MSRRLATSMKLQCKLLASDILNKKFILFSWRKICADLNFVIIGVCVCISSGLKSNGE